MDSNVGSSSRESLDGHGIFAIVVFAVVALVCIQPIHIPLPLCIATCLERLKRKLLVPASDISLEGRHQSPVLNLSHPSHQSSRQSEQSGGSNTRAHIVLDHVWTPLIGILFLLTTRTIGGEQIKLGIRGEDDIEPYDVLLFFISLAYIAISLDATGLLRFLAFQVCLKAGSHGQILFLTLYAFFWGLGVLIGNDPVILSGTAFLVYLTRVAGISPPSAWIWGQFVAANISSAVLVSSNPTNLVVASGFGISFPIYTAHMILPAFVSALVSYCVLLVYFRNEDNQTRNGIFRSKATGVQGRVRSLLDASVLREPRRRRQFRSSTKQNATSQGPRQGEHITMQNVGEQYVGGPIEDNTKSLDGNARKTPLVYIPSRIIRPDVDARAALVDPKGAIFVSVIMAATLITLIITSVTGGVKVYMIAAPGAGVCLIRDVLYDMNTWRKLQKAQKNAQKSSAEGTEAQESDSNSAQGGHSDHPTSTMGQRNTPLPMNRANVVDQTHSMLAWISRTQSAMKEMFPIVMYVMSRLPISLLPFAFGMFILVQGLEHVGFINIMAKGLGNTCSTGYIGCSFFISTLGVVLCNLGGTNIGATILLTKALKSPHFLSRLPQSDAALIEKAASYSVAFGSNVGALGGTFAASLAGLLWRDVLRQRGVLVTKKQFLVWCAVLIIPATISGVAILLVEVRYFAL